jgi:hypothetical protein
MSDPRWYVLVHQLPQEPLYLRAKIRNCLGRVGAVALKRSVYVLPRREDLLEALRRIAGDIMKGGGAADIFEGNTVGSRTNEDLECLFRQERSEEYGALARQVRGWSVERRTAPLGVVRLRLARARKSLEAIERRDYFECTQRQDVQTALTELGAALSRPPDPAPPRRHAHLVGRTWVTRRGIQVDRIACAWFIRRFLDPKARLRFIEAGGDVVAAGEIRFDMAGGDFTHEDDRCSFETLIHRTRVEDRALALVAEIVHEIDIKDGKYQRPETGGVRHLVQGLILAHPEDPPRLERGFALFDDLYDSFRRQLGLAPSASSGPGRPPGAHSRKGGPA